MPPVCSLPGTLHPIIRSPPGKVEIVEHNSGKRYTPADFRIERKVVSAAKYVQGPPVDDEVLAQKIGYVETALKAAGIEGTFSEYGDRAYILDEFTCPWAAEHTTPGDTADIFLCKDGGYGFHCFHRCRAKNWKEHFKVHGCRRRTRPMVGKISAGISGTAPDQIPADQRTSGIVILVR